MSNIDVEIYEGYICPICYEVFSSIECLLKHIRYWHGCEYTMFYDDITSYSPGDC